MAQASPYLPPEGWSQRKQRREVKHGRDIHGRPWHWTIENKTGDPTGLIQALFQAPIIPPQEYLRPNPENPNQLLIDYDRWISAIRARRKEWEKEGRQRSQKLYGQKYRAEDEFTDEVLDIIGPPPEAWEPILAAKQGNPWILGKTTRVDLRLAQFFEPEQLDPTERAAREPDFSKLVSTEAQLDESNLLDDKRSEEDPDYRPPVGRGGARNWDEEMSQQRQRIVTGRPQPRAAGKGAGGGKNKPKSEKPKRQRYPQGHPKAGTFIPKAELEKANETELVPAGAGAPSE